jgi:hypothetical protein
MNLLRAQAYLALLLGTTPPMPGAAGGTSEDDGPEGPGEPGQPGGPGGTGEPIEADDSGQPGGPGESGGPEDAAPPEAQPPASDLDEPGDSPAPGDSPSAAASSDLSPAGGQPAWPGIQPDLPWTTTMGEPPAGLLNLTVPLATLAGTTGTPGQLTWLGIITPSQARHLTELAARHPGTRWRVVVVNHSGHAIAVTHVPRSRSPGNRDGPGNRDDPDDPDSPGEPDKARTGLIRRVTLITSTRQLANSPPTDDANPPGVDPPVATILDQALTAAKRAAEEAARRAAEDQRAGGCAHQLASAAYRPPPRITELVAARDQTCRHPTCRRPAEMCDLDHVQPYDQGGPTCSCNLGAECRTDHQLKQDLRWALTQTPGGKFRWTTPTGRTYISRPDPYFL